jgi:phosphatidylglycerol:prolipoprotein diacylglycerol transferase
VDGCCAGKVLYISDEGIPVVFPSQTTELVNALVIMAILMLMSRSKKFRGRIFCWYMIIYGVSRFVLNLLRAETEIYIFGMTAGNVWSILAIIVGIMWLREIKQRETQKR